MNHLDLFSGIGGFAYAARLANTTFENCYYSDIEEYANEVYSKNFPTATPLGDIRGINANALKAKHKDSWIVTGGFPCQDLSVAGKRVGINGARSSLWFEMHRVIDELHPAYVIAENVPTLCRNGLDTVLGSLADIGYDAEWRVISAAEIGAPHVRKRVWIVAYPTSNAEVFGLVDALESHTPQLRENVGDYYESHGKVNRDYAWIDWTRAIAEHGALLPKSRATRMDDGLSERLDIDLARVRALGNAIVPQIAAMLFKRIRAIEDFFTIGGIQRNDRSRESRKCG